MIFYYTATGNSLYVAKKLDTEVISIPQVKKGNIYDFESETIGIVAPVYAGELPKTVVEFMQKAHLKADYIYMVLTYGKDDSVAAQWSDKLASENGINIDYIETIEMVDNYLPSFDMNEQKEIEKNVDQHIEKVIQNIASRKQFIPRPTLKGKGLYAMVQKRFKDHPEYNNGEQLEIIEEQCIGCSICTKVCPIGNIQIVDGKAVRKNKTCDFCLACIQNCPHKAISLKLSDINPKARYRHPDISLKEITDSNNQE